jgi:hypothetical protein
MKIQDMRGHFAGQNIGNLPINNIAPFLQSLGDMGVTVGDLIPFLSDSVHLDRLAKAIKSLGLGLTEGELRAVSILGWDGVMLAPSVFGTLGLSGFANAKRGIAIDDDVLIECAIENKQPPRSQRWSLVYTAPLSLLQLQQAVKGLPNELRVYGEIRGQGQANDPAWATEPAAEGYKLVCFGAYEGSKSKEIWKKQNAYLRKQNMDRLSVAEFSQAAIMYPLLNRMVPEPMGWNSKTHWAVYDDKVSVAIHPSDCGSTDVRVESSCESLMNVTCAAKLKV